MGNGQGGACAHDFLSRALSGTALYQDKLSEWGKLAKVAILMVGTSIADERTFSMMNFVTEQHPSLTRHFEATLRMAEQNVFDICTFPLDEARKERESML
jgi:hypothetical protein